MKKLLLIPTAIFPYSVCALLAYCFGNGKFGGDPIINVLGTACIVCALLSFVCNILFMVFSGKQSPNSLIKISLILKAIHIPAYVLIFIVGLVMGFMFFMTFPIIILLVFIDCVTMFFSGMISVFSLIKIAKTDIMSAFVAIVCQFFFCADIISLFVLYYTLNENVQTILPNESSQ